MPYPTPKVEIAFDAGPYDPTPTWTPVTQWVYSMTTDRGRSDDWGDFYGAASVTLNNRDRRFDPFNTSSPYWDSTNNKTKLLPRRQIRITATFAGVDYPVFRGFVAGWPPVWTDAGRDSTVTLSCFDALGLLASNTLPTTYANAYITSLSPRHWWRMDDPVGYFQTTATIRDYGSLPNNLTTNTSTFQGGELASGLSQQSITSTGFVNGALGVGTDVLQSANTTSDVTIAYWVKSEASDSNASNALIATAGFANVELSQFTANGGSYGKITAAIYTAGNFTTWLSVNAYEPSNVYHLAFTYNRGTGVGTIYVNGIADTAAPSTIVGFTTVPANEVVSLSQGSFAQVLVFSRVLTQTEIRTIVNFSQAQVSETTSARVSRIIAETPFSASLVSTPASPVSTVLDISPGAVKAASELQTVADSEYAPLFVDRSGTVTLYNQNQIRTQTRSVVSQGTYGAGGIAIGPDVAIAYDGDSMRNEASIQMSGQGFYNQDNTTSQNTFGVAEESLTTQVQTFANAIGIANIVTGWGGQVYPKADPFDVVLSPTADWSNALNRELNDRITLVIQPPTGSAINTQMLLSSIRHSVVPGEWRTTFEGSARWAAVFILNKSTLGGTDLLG